MRTVRGNETRQRFPDTMRRLQLEHRKRTKPMTTTRCCAKCKHPILSCRHTDCKCHAGIDAQIIELRKGD